MTFHFKMYGYLSSESFALYSCTFRGERNVCTQCMLFGLSSEPRWLLNEEKPGECLFLVFKTLLLFRK